MLASLKSNALTVAVTSTRSVEFSIVPSRDRDFSWSRPVALGKFGPGRGDVGRIGQASCRNGRCMTVGIRWAWYAIRPSIIDHQLWPPGPMKAAASWAPVRVPQLSTARLREPSLQSDRISKRFDDYQSDEMIGDNAALLPDRGFGRPLSRRDAANV